MAMAVTRPPGHQPTAEVSGGWGLGPAEHLGWEPEAGVWRERIRGSSGDSVQMRQMSGAEDQRMLELEDAGGDRVQLLPNSVSVVVRVRSVISKKN